MRGRFVQRVSTPARDRVRFFKPPPRCALVLEVLTRNGRSDLAYALLLQDTAPSWLYQVHRGATTVWETWEGYDKSGSATMSHNHYSFGSIAGWMFENIVGIRPLEPGYRRFRIDPVPGDLASASGEIETGYGRISVSWETDELGATRITASVPHGTHAVVTTSTGDAELSPGEHEVVFSPAAPSTERIPR